MKGPCWRHRFSLEARRCVLLAPVGVLACVGTMGEVDSPEGIAGDTTWPSTMPGGSKSTGNVPLPSVPGCQGSPDPGHVVVHRLNRVEYNNTVRDLLGNGGRPADEFPRDDTVGGFDNNSTGLNV